MILEKIIFFHELGMLNPILIGILVGYVYYPCQVWSRKRMPS